MIRLFDLDARIDRASCARQFAARGRVQIRDVLSAPSAATVRVLLDQQTPWGIALKAGDGPVEQITNAALRGMAPAAQQKLNRDIHAAAGRGEYAVRFTQYPLLDAYLGRWAPGGPHDLLLEHINDGPFLDLVRTVSGMPDLVKADAQATLFGPGDFLFAHNDSHVADGWKLAYVLSFAPPDWKPDWGGYLNFLDADGDIIEGWRPRFNVLNLFRVPQMHQVTYVPPFAPRGRYAITGWFRDR